MDCSGVDYVLGLAQNARLRKELQEDMAKAKAADEKTKASAREFKDFTYKTLESWACGERNRPEPDATRFGSNCSRSEHSFA
jgi:hypothetical protein